MVVKILGAIDLVAGIILIFGSEIDLPWRVFFVVGALLLIKSFLGGIPKDPASVIDFFAGLVLFLSILISFPWYITVILGVLVIQKSIVSFLG